jgi:UDP-GlcNAc:undecaprenyl-phosphate GlcNAc-1-phosphate transferase
MNPLLAMVFAMAVSMALIPIVWRYAPKLGLLDMPDARKVHHQAVPRVGGWGIALGTAAAIFTLLPLDPLIQSYLAGALILFLFGVWDDIRHLGHYLKFLGQFMAVAIVVFHGGLWIERMPFGEVGAAFGIPFTFFAIVGMANAINTSDGLDGLAGGESLISLAAIAYLSFIVDGVEMAAVAVAAIGGILGFLRFNTHPAQIFMGDGGSQFLGFTLGFFAVWLTQRVHAAMSPAATLLFLGLPIIDILSAMAKRMSEGRKWYIADKCSHIHHRLLGLGFSHRETVVIIYGLQGLLVAGAVFLRYEYDAVVMAFYFFSWAVFIGALTMAEKSGWRRESFQALAPSGDSTGEFRRLGWPIALRRIPPGMLWVLIPAYLLGMSLWVKDPSKDFSMLSALLSVVMAVELLFGRGGGSLISRGIIYTSAVFVTYLYFHTPLDTLPAFWKTLEAAYFMALAVAVALCMRFAHDNKFLTTPLDYLLLIGALAIGVLGQRLLQTPEVGNWIIKTAILLYGCEVLAGTAARRWNLLSVSCAASLGILGARGLFW